MLLKLLLIIVGGLLSALGFFVVRWMSEMEKKWEATRAVADEAKRENERVATRVERLEQSSVASSNCADRVSLFTQKINRERHRINALEDLLRSGGLMHLVRNLDPQQGNAEDAPTGE